MNNELRPGGMAILLPIPNIDPSSAHAVGTVCTVLRPLDRRTILDMNREFNLGRFVNDEWWAFESPVLPVPRGYAEQAWPGSRLLPIGDDPDDEVTEHEDLLEIATG